MSHMRDMFYGPTEPVWILNHDKDDGTDEEENESGSMNSPENNRYSPPTSNHQYLTDRNYFAEPQNERYPPPASNHYYDYFAGPAYDYTAEEEREVVMKVPICCGECEESVRVALFGLEGVKSVKCDIYHKRVTVVVTTRAPADVLMECKKRFKKSRMWSDDD